MNFAFRKHFLETLPTFRFSYSVSYPQNYAEINSSAAIHFIACFFFWSKGFNLHLVKTMEVRPNPADDNSSIPPPLPPQQHQHHAHAAPSKQLKAAPNPVDTSSVSQRSISYLFSHFLLISVWLWRKIREVRSRRYWIWCLVFWLCHFPFLDFLFGCGKTNWRKGKERKILM